LHEKGFHDNGGQGAIFKVIATFGGGRRIPITKRGVPVARLVPVEAQKGKRQLGFCEGKFTVPDDFDAPLPDEILDAFEGNVTQCRKKA